MEIIRAYIRDRVTVEDCGHGTDCWLWSRCTRDGYGRADLGGRIYQAHRVSYAAFISEIPSGLELDHLCCVSNCVNPAHLEPVTREENLRRKHVRRGYVIGGKVRMDRGPRPPRKPPVPKTRCVNGHEYTTENTRFVVNGRGYTVRACRTCLRLQDRAKKLRLKELAASAKLSLAGGCRADSAGGLTGEIAPHKDLY